VPTGEKSKWSQGGDAIDTSSYDAAIVSAEKTLTAKPTDAAAKKAVGDAYYKRADALTQARQYAAALGDYRRALKADPSNPDAKKWIDQITSIYQSMNKESPPEGQEPPPLPFKK
jgi:tetratricopeptide (TPR) repeat protein